MSYLTLMIFPTDTALQLDAARKHFNEQITLYGDTSLVNLVNRKGHEQPLKDTFEQRLSDVSIPSLSSTLLVMNVYDH